MPIASPTPPADLWVVIAAYNEEPRLGATLAVAGKFEFTESRLGLKHARTLTVDGQFDYQKQALLYVPQHLPDPRSPVFSRAAAEEIVKILNHSRRS